LRGDNTMPLADRVRACIAKFAEIGVTQQMIEKRFNHKIKAIDVHELVALGKIFNSLRDNMAKIEDYFEKPQIETLPATEEDAQAVNEAQKKLFAEKK